MWDLPQVNESQYRNAKAEQDDQEDQKSMKILVGRLVLKVFLPHLKEVLQMEGVIVTTEKQEYQIEDWMVEWTEELKQQLTKMACVDYYHGYCLMSIHNCVAGAVSIFDQSVNEEDVMGWRRCRSDCQRQHEIDLR